ncbi:type II toxin-antitoxin system VapC family toxin [Microbacterium sp. KUDC0406]|uniref:type II toxin-antitoxin system VapC family toxin n=1 Tax=Microbacterium sp. KUDC0406 TaxID=2909588 RepID=UPI001F4690F5|nr:type II toxin-antitoxin system VapC family toxin [Microbacterium sp. KUDC0406]UJP10490.1 type II toxin-antitoxin system VapC family toxin [Microbacterium sp. KUDC0406]
MYLLDTNAYSESRRPGLLGETMRTWLADTPPEVTFMSAITDYELERGVLHLQRRDPRQATALRGWLTTVRSGLEGRILSVTPEIARVFARLDVPDRRPWADALIAATALHHDLTVVTRNEKDFDVPGLRVINPFSGD